MIARFVVQWRRDDVLAVVVGNGGANGGRWWRCHGADSGEVQGRW